MIHWVHTTFKLVYGHLNGIFLTSNFAWAYSRHFANSGQKDRAKFPNFDPCTVCGKKVRVSKRAFLPAFWATNLSTVLLVWPKKQLTEEILLTAFWATVLAQNAGKKTLLKPATFCRTLCKGQNWEFCQVLLPTVYKQSGEGPRKIAAQKNAVLVPVYQFESGPNSVNHTV